MAASKSINLALQGGGSHGAFTWGVLDRLLEDERLLIAAISGTSAGAMNAVLVADGLGNGGRTVARERLASFWKAVSDAARFSPIQRTPIDRFMGNWSMDSSPGYLWFDMASRFFAPSQVNPLKLNPLRDILLEHVDFDDVRACQKLRLYISATNVETGRVRVFERGEVNADVVMASACLPFLFEAVEIDGAPYWDGGYAGNPPLFPLVAGQCDDIVIVQINPIERAGTPTSAHEIHNRINEITFNQSLLKELRAIEFVHRLLEQGRLDAQEYHDMRIHIIENQDCLKPLGASSKLNAEWEFLTYLRDIGRLTASRWLEQHYAQLGKNSTVDLQAMFQGSAIGG
ncbi:MAG: patatin-like phospholipase family protein [Thiolinea sp.]